MSDQLAEIAGPPRDGWGRYLLPTVDSGGYGDGDGMAPRLKPVLILKVPGVTDPGRWLAVTRLEDLEL